MPNRTHHPYKDPPLVGAHYGRWTVVEGPYSVAPKKVRILCRCDCGTIKEINYGHMRAGRSKSCGCLRREITIARSTKHGYSHHPLFQLWLGIRRRCNDPQDARYEWYGARGIKMCSEWETDAGEFVEYVLTHLGPRPDGSSIDRIDNEEGYRPGNIRWATAREQIENSRRFVNGEIMQCCVCARFISLDTSILTDDKYHCSACC